MKLFYIECNEDELKENRGIMDAIVDACQGLLGGFYGSYTPAPAEEQDDDEESEEKPYEKGSAYDKCPICVNRNKNCQFGSLDCHFEEQIMEDE